MKFFDFEIKGLDGLGVIDGTASAYGNVDRQGDVVMPGAFTKSLAESHGRVPLLWQHRQDEPIGSATLTDSPSGLLLRAQLDLDVDMGKRAYSSLRKQIVTGLSIGYETVRATMKGGVRQLLELKLYEVSVVTIPANPQSTVSGVKDQRTGDSSISDFMRETTQIAECMVILGQLRQLNRELTRSR